MHNIIEKKLIGIVYVDWDYDDKNIQKEAFYEFCIEKVNEKIEFVNKYKFLEKNVCVGYDETYSTKLFLNELGIIDNDKIKIQICSDILYLSLEQYKILNEAITEYRQKYQFEIKMK